jgi:predicted nucleotidyltransferase
MKTTDDYVHLLRQFKQEYATEYGIMKIGIFGSVARGEHIEGSDIDIFYEGPSMGLKSLVRLPAKLAFFLGIPVDVIRKHKNLRPGLIQTIERDIIYV